MLSGVGDSLVQLGDFRFRFRFLPVIRKLLLACQPRAFAGELPAESVRLIAGELLKRCMQLCSTTPVTAHRQMLLRRMFCGRLLISPHPVAAHHSTSSSATLNSRPHRYSRGSPRPEVRGLRQGQADLGVTWRSAAELVFSPAIGGLFPTSDHGELFRHH